MSRTNFASFGQTAIAIAIGGVGCLVDSCRACDSCRADREQNCTRSAAFTCNSTDAHGTAPVTYGGCFDRIVVTEHFVIRIPPGAGLAATAPLLCAGITTFSPTGQETSTCEIELVA
ncbi:MAG: hypothetical protein IPL90_05715 [Holophagales bacterium]|nr:hypothetical protein [Holophagales bacterium]